MTLANFGPVYVRQTTKYQYWAIHISLLLVQEMVELSLLQVTFTLKQLYNMEIVVLI